MAVSVRMEPLLEKELEQAARRQGITKSQFIIQAVERALGRRDPAALYHQVMEDAGRYEPGDSAPDDVPPSTHQATLRRKLRAAHAGQQDDYAAWLAQRQAAGKDQP